MIRRSLIIALATLAVSCHSAGLYGHSQTYEPLGDEEDAEEGAVKFDPVMVQRSPEKFKGTPMSLYGVVTGRREGPGGAADVTLSVRTLEPRNLCESADEDTCRVTVSDREHAIVHARLSLRPDDAIGEHPLGARSLVRVIGTLADGVDEADGHPVLVAKYYRHWPRDFYVTTAARAYMLR
jgi:hypothetical protein